MIAFSIFGWLAACTYSDLRFREVPAWLTLPPLVFGMIWSALTEDVTATLVTLSILLSENIPVRSRAFYGIFQGLLVLLAFKEAGLAGLSLAGELLGIWLAWKLGAFGGADAQVLMALALILGAGIIVPIMFATGLQGIFGWLRRQTTIPAMLGIFAGTCTALFLKY